MSCLHINLLANCTYSTAFALFNCSEILGSNFVSGCTAEQVEIAKINKYQELTLNELHFYTQWPPKTVVFMA